MKVNFEASTSCNAKCTFCPRSEMKRAGEMSDNLFHKIIKDGKDMGVKHYSPFLMGEPFVFPRIWEWLDYMQKEGVKVSLFTNAEFLDVDRLIKYKNIWYVNCSLNAATEETHKKIMRGPKWDTVKKNIDDLYERAPFSTRVSMIVCDENVHEVEQFEKMYKRHKVNGFANWTGDKHAKVERKGKKEPCWVLLNQMTILFDGSVVPCCMSYNKKMVLGNANKQTLKEIFDSYEWMRKKHQEGKWDKIPICKGCNYNTINRR